MKLRDCQLKTGDILLFEGRDPISLLIRWRTFSRFSHVGFVFQTKINGYERLAVLEAVERQGVRLYPLDKCIQDRAKNSERVHWFKTTDQSINKERLIEHVLKNWGKRYAPLTQLADSWGLITNFFKKLFKKQHKDIDRGERFFCSELVADALRASGYKPEEGIELPPYRTSPGDISLYPCFQRMGVIEL